MNEWKERGACFNSNSDVFFNEYRAAEARAICNRCEVIKECLKYVQEANPPEGIWAGMTIHERKVLFPRDRAGNIKVSYRQFS